MASTFTFVPNKPGIRAMLKSQMAQDLAMHWANKAVEVAKSTAPVSDSAEASEAGNVTYAESIEAIPRMSDHRAWAAVYAGVPYAFKLQAETGHLHQAVDAVREDA